jgi:hypothetical protein
MVVRRGISWARSPCTTKLIEGDEKEEESSMREGEVRDSPEGQAAPTTKSSASQGKHDGSIDEPDCRRVETPLDPGSNSKGFVDD